VPDVPALRFEELGRSWADFQSHLDQSDTVTAANSLMEELSDLGPRLRSTDEGQLALDRLMQDADPYVRLVASREAPFFHAGDTRAVLEELVRSGPAPANISAKYTLQEFDAGRLS
jgi:hypothetical protein